MTPAPVREGEILAGKYRVERVLGVGGMGVVVAATHLQLEERVAIKFLLDEALGNGEAVARFAREARAAVKIKSEHVARVIDVGTLETGAPYMVMEYLDGEDLSQVLVRRGKLPLEEAVEYVLQACEAIAHAHVLGIVHRDLKPANLFLVRRPDGTYAVKVLDFGISKVLPGKGGSSDHAMTRTHTVMGSPLYMSPEQMASTRDVDVRTDLWALGAILYELTSGEAPFNADTVPQLCALILNGATPSIRDRLPTAPVALDAVLRRCLEKDPARRYANVAELAAALAELGPRRARASVERIARIVYAGSQPPGALAAAITSDSLAQTGGSWADTRSVNATGNGARSRKGLWIGLGAGAIVVGAGVFLALRSPTDAATSLVQLAPPFAGVSASALGSPSAAPTAPLAVAPAVASASAGAGVAPSASSSPAESGAPGAVGSSSAAASASAAVGPGAVLPPKAAGQAEAPRPGAKKGPRPASPAPPPAAPGSAKPTDLFDDRK